ncbi:MAG TPA: hypothetical protein VFW17_15485 [Ktedonobacterales bacterium]|nr:hypothetical protein [Ktedonobacterales bacterium]
MLNGKHRQPGPVPGPLCGSYAHVLPVLDDVTDAHLAADVRAHLADCAWCRAQRTTYDHFDEALRLHFAPDAMPFLQINATEFAMSDIHDHGATDIPPDESDEAADDDALRLTFTPLSIPPRPPRRSWRLATGAASLAAVLVISLLAELIFASHGRPQSASNRHATSTPAIAPGSQKSLMAIGMASATDGWAMGTQVLAGQDGGSSDDLAYVMHYTGGQWVPVTTQIHAWIKAIKMFSPSDGWAIGNRVYHYDGASWREVSLPVAAGFNAIAAVSPTDVWIAGDGSYASPPDGNVTILHYDGKSWTRQATPRLSDFFSIASLSMVSPDEGWAVGSATLDGSKGWYPPTGAILHYVNGAWRMAKTLPAMNLQTISMGSASDGWVGGNMVTYSKTGKLPQTESPYETDTPKLWRYTGGRWVEVNTPRSNRLPEGAPSEGQISSITMFSATEGWMFGQLDYGMQSLDDSTALGPEAFHLEHGRWVQVQTPSLQQRRSVYLSQIALLTPDEFWGVGTSLWQTGIPSGPGTGYTPTVTPLIAHYKGGVWGILEH